MPSPRAPTEPHDRTRHALMGVVPLLTPLLVLAVLLVGYATVIRPRADRLHALRTAVTARADDLARARARSTQVADARAALAAIPADDLRVIDALAPAGEDVPGLFAAVDAAAQRAGIAVSSMEVAREDSAREAPAPGARAIAVGVTLRNTDYPRLKAFLDVLAASRRLLDVQSFQFTPASLHATVRLRAYTVE